MDWKKGKRKFLASDNGSKNKTSEQKEEKEIEEDGRESEGTVALK